jgi:mono/diheme cytochrome c family protein
MKTRLLLFSAIAVFLTATSAALVAGQAAAPAPAASRTVWDGVFSTAQAQRGQRQFAEHCAECHGPELMGGDGPALVGDRFWQDWREATVGELYEHISKNMPHPDFGALPGSLPRPTYEDVTAYILSSNGFPAGQADLTATSSVGIQIIRREGPGELPATTLARVVGCLEKGSGSDWRLTRASRPVRENATNRAAAKEMALGDRDITLKFVLTPLTRYIGHKVTATGALIGEGGSQGMNTDNVTSIAPMCP